MKTFDEMIEKIEACGGRDLNAKTAEGIKKFVRTLNFDVAASVVSELCALPRMPANIIAAVEGIVRSRQPRREGTPMPTNATNDNDPPAPREWADRYDEVAADILRYHRNDMAAWVGNELVIEPIPDGAALSCIRDADGYSPLERACPHGWYPVVSHFCVTKHERTRTYSAERNGNTWGRVTEHVIYDPAPHDPVYAKIDGTDTGRQLAYMDYYAAALRKARDARMLNVAVEEEAA